MSFVGRWLAEAVRLVLALGLALAAMQLPAIAAQYAAGLLQVAESGRRDIEQREGAARSFYPGAGADDADVIATLEKVEPSNAQALRVSVDRVAALGAAYRRVDGAAAVLRPVVAGLDAADDAGGEKGAILRTTLATYSPQILLQGVALLYGLAGLLAGSLVAETVVAIFRPRRRGWAR